MKLKYCHFSRSVKFRSYRCHNACTFYNIIVFIHFNNSTCTLLCVVIRIHRVLYPIGTSCSNCGVRRPTDGLCSRCLDLPYCKVCKRHLENNCFNEVQHNICQVHLQIVLFLHVTITCILHTGTNRIIISHIAIVTRSLVCLCV